MIVDPPDHTQNQEGQAVEEIKAQPTVRKRKRKIADVTVSTRCLRPRGELNKPKRYVEINHAEAVEPSNYREALKSPNSEK